MWQVPSVVGSNKYRWQLTRTPYARRFISEVCSQFSTIISKGEREGADSDAAFVFI